jgi:hypothetical protein
MIDGRRGFQSLVGQALRLLLSKSVQSEVDQSREPVSGPSLKRNRLGITIPLPSFYMPAPILCTMTRWGAASE